MKSDRQESKTNQSVKFMSQNCYVLSMPLVRRWFKCEQYLPPLNGFHRMEESVDKGSPHRSNCLWDGHGSDESFGKWLTLIEVFSLLLPSISSRSGDVWTSCCLHTLRLTRLTYQRETKYSCSNSCFVLFFVSFSNANAAASIIYSLSGKNPNFNTAEPFLLQKRWLVKAEEYWEQ